MEEYLEVSTDQRRLLSQSSFHFVGPLHFHHSAINATFWIWNMRRNNPWLHILIVTEDARNADLVLELVLWDYYWKELFGAHYSSALTDTCSFVCLQPHQSPADMSHVWWKTKACLIICFLCIQTETQSVTQWQLRTTAMKEDILKRQLVKRAHSQWLLRTPS